MELETARRVAGEVVDRLKPYCRRIEIAGSIRRQRPLCGDIDIVLVPANQGMLAVALNTLGQKKKSGPRYHCCLYRGVQVDIYIATEASWATLLLIRTGSAKHNVWLCSKAKAMGMTLHADGSGMTYENKHLVPTTEALIFDLLKLPYRRPEEREVPH